MLLAIDIGNTNIAFGGYEGSMLKVNFRLTTRSRLTDDEAGISIINLLEQNKVRSGAVDKVVIGSVVPSLTPVFEGVARKYFDCVPVVVSHQVRLPIKIEIDRPGELGADRIANAVAGYGIYGGPTIVVDFGTATTFDVIDSRGTYIGGVITPGPETSMAELAKRAARLFEVRLEPPASVVGKSTAGALKSGLFYGTVGQVDYIVDRIVDECGFKQCTVIATGGLSCGIEQYSQQIKQVLPALTLEGLRIIGEMN